MWVARRAGSQYFNKIGNYAKIDFDFENIFTYCTHTWPIQNYIKVTNVK